MSCVNNIFLTCCNGDGSFSINPCNPVIDGSVGSFVDGLTYVSTGDTTNGDICWSATTTQEGSLVNYTPPGFGTITNGTADCDQCQFDYGGACLSFSASTNVILVNCCDPTDTLDAEIINSGGPPIGTVTVYNDTCYTVSSLGGSGGPQVLITYDGCAPCLLNFPCCECTEMEIDSSLPIFADDGNVYVDYTACDGTPTQVVGTSSNLVFNICSLSGQSITTSLTIGSSLFSGNTYPFDPSSLGEVNATFISTCSSDPCGISVTPTPTITPSPTSTPVLVTPTNTQTPTTTPVLVTPTNTPTPTTTLIPVTPTPSSSSPGFGNGLVFDYTLNVTGACQTGFGAVLIEPLGGVGPYTFDWYNPELGLGAFKDNLPAGTYFVRANDSQLPVNNEFFINIIVSDCLCVSVLNVNSTTCGLDNGSVTGTSSSVFATTNYYLYTGDDTYITSAVTNTGTVEFTSLSAGTYYLYGFDLGGATGYSQNFIVQQSSPLNYGLYVVPDASCNTFPIGKIFVTGVTGTPPFSYLWNNGQTTSSITGLTSGVYSVQVTDFYGCQLTQNALVTEVEPVGLGAFTSVPPTCFEANGSVTIIITGGTAPYYYSASTGYVEISYATSLTISGLSSGNYSFQVTDAALCSFNATTSITSPGGISSVNVSTTNSVCSSTNGSITVQVIGGVSPYTYTLIDPNANTDVVTSNQTTEVFPNLETGTYTIFVEDTTGCVYSTEVTLIAEEKFTTSLSITGSTCGNPQGILDVTISSGATLPVTYSIDGTNNIVGSFLTTVTFSNVTVGQHLLSITDASGCTLSTPFTMTSTPAVDFSLYSTSCGSGSEGTLTAFITQGIAPYTFTWSNNIQGNPQNISVTGLTGGTYTLIVQDVNGCSLARQTSIECNAKCVTYQTYTMGSEVFNILSPTKHGINQILVEGFNDLTSGNTNCTLLSAVFTAQVEVQPQNTVISNTFYTGTTLVDVPSDNTWFTEITNLLQGVSGVLSVTIDPLTNQISISANPNSSIIGQELSVKLIIVYDIICLT